MGAAHNTNADALLQNVKQSTECVNARPLRRSLAPRARWAPPWGGRRGCCASLQRADWCQRADGACVFFRPWRRRSKWTERTGLLGDLGQQHIREVEQVRCAALPRMSWLPLLIAVP